MKPNNLIVKFIAGVIYWFVFLGISFVVAMAFAFCVVLLRKNGIILGKIGEAIPIVTFLGLLAYSSWIARKSAIAFSDNNCFFFEAAIISVKESFLYLSFLPFIGQFFHKQRKFYSYDNEIKEIDHQDRFGKYNDKFR